MSKKSVPWKTGAVAGVVSLLTGATVLHYLSRVFSHFEVSGYRYIDSYEVFLGYVLYHVIYFPELGWLPMRQERGMTLWLYPLPALVLIATGYYLARQRDGSDTPVISGASAAVGYLTVIFFVFPFLFDEFVKLPLGITSVILQLLLAATVFGGIGGYIYGYRAGDEPPNVKRELRETVTGRMAVASLLILVLAAGVVLISANPLLLPGNDPDPATTCSQELEAEAGQTHGTYDPSTVEAQKLSTTTEELASPNRTHPPNLNGGGETVQAAVSIHVDDSNGTVDVSILTMGNADYVMLTGDHVLHCNPYLESTGQTLTLTEQHLEDSGEITAVGVIGGGEFYEERGIPTMEVERGATQTGLQNEDWDFTETR